MEENCRYGEIAVVDVSHDRSAIGMIFNVDLSELDPGTIKLGLEPYAVAAPARGQQGRRVCLHRIHSHAMDNHSDWPGYFDRWRLKCVAFVTLAGLFTPHFGGNQAVRTSSTGVKRCLMRVLPE
jgi:hypothetical protein